MTRQLAFDLPARPALGREDFFVTPANALAVAAMDHWREWPGRRLLLIGPRESGKTHLAHVWAAGTGASIASAQALGVADPPELAARPALVVEDVDRVAGLPDCEAALLHLYNLAAESGCHLLLTGTGRARDWPLHLPDLASRLQAAPVATLDAMDDALLSALIAKLFTDRQLRVSPPVIAYLVRRIERSHAAARRAVEALDARALAEGRTVSRALAAELLEASALDKPLRGGT